VNEGPISSEGEVNRNFEAPGAGEISFLEYNTIIPIGRKKRTEFGTTRRFY